jgi:hypothetical protein
MMSISINNIFFFFFPI